MRYAGDLTTYSLGGTSFLSDFTNVSFEVTAKTEEGKGGAQRYASAVVVKRSFEAKTEIMRTVTGTRQVSISLSVASVGSTDYVANIRTFTLNVNTTTQESSARGDEFETFQATGTKFTGSAQFQVLNADASTVFDLLLGSRSDLSTTISITVGGEVLVLPITITKSGTMIERDGLILIPFEFEERGTPTTATGSTLLASILTGTALITMVATITGLGTYTGDTLIESATFTMPEEGLITEQYTFKGLGALVKS